MMTLFNQEYALDAYTEEIRQESLQEGLQEGRKEGLQEGERLAKKEMTLNLKKRGFTDGQIVQIVGESEEVIREWLESEMLLAK